MKTSKHHIHESKWFNRLQHIPRWLFQRFVIFPNWGNEPIWLIWYSNTKWVSNGLKPPTNSRYHFPLDIPDSPQAIRPYARLSLTRHGMNSPALQWDGPSRLQCLGSRWVDIPRNFLAYKNSVVGFVPSVKLTYIAPENGSNGWL